MIRFFILVVYSVLICLLYSIAIGQPQPKIGVTPVEFYFEEKPIWHEDIREPWHFIEIAKDINLHIIKDLRYRLGWVNIYEIPFEISYRVDDYLAFAKKEKFDILLLYTIQYEPISDLTPSDEIENEVKLDGNLIIVETGDKWGHTSMIFTGMQEINKWLINMAKEAKNAVPINYNIKSDPTEQMCFIDGEYKGSTPVRFSAFRIIGHDTSVEVYFELDKVCRKKIEKIMSQGQIIEKNLKPSDSAEPPYEFFTGSLNRKNR